jgi:hypothetical protein
MAAKENRMKRSITTATIASLSAAALALTLGVTTATAEVGTTVKLGEQKAEHGYGGYGQPRSSGQTNRHQYDDHHRHDYGQRGYQPHGNGHRPSGHGVYAGRGHSGHRNHGYASPRHSSHGYAQHRNYYCSHCHYRTTSYSIFYNHVHHHHHVPWYDISALIVFDPINLFFTFGGSHSGHHSYANHH